MSNLSALALEAPRNLERNKSWFLAWIHDSLLLIRTRLDARGDLEYSGCDSSCRELSRLVSPKSTRMKKISRTITRAMVRLRSDAALTTCIDTHVIVLSCSYNSTRSWFTSKNPKFVWFCLRKILSQSGSRLAILRNRFLSPTFTLFSKIRIEMPRRPSKKSKNASASKPRKLVRSDGKIKKWNNSEDISMDEEDQCKPATWFFTWLLLLRSP